VRLIGNASASGGQQSEAVHVSGSKADISLKPP
jgi:hypothetical protein